LYVYASQTGTVPPARQYSPPARARKALVNEISAKCGVIVIEGPQQRIDIPLRIADPRFEDPSSPAIFPPSAGATSG
jgi:hypothetical protein